MILGNGNGTFATPVRSAFTPGAYGGQLIDINHDGKPDLVTSDFLGDTVFISMNDGAGRFRAPNQVTVSPVLTVVAAGDLNADGQVDLVIGHSLGRKVEVFLGSNLTQFSRVNSYPTPYDVSDIKIAEMSGDALPDLVVSSSEIRVYVNQGSGAFLPGRSVASAGDLAVADFDGDSRRDVAYTLGVGSTQVAVVKTLSDGSFGAPELFAVGRQPEGIAAGDLNGDARPDLAVGNRVDDTVSVLLSQA